MKKKGLTLIELIAVLAITPIILAAIYQAIVVGYRLLNNGTKLTNVQEQSKAMLATLTHQLKNSRFYLDTYDFSSANPHRDDRFDSLPGTKVCYLEGYDDKRYLYSFVDNGTEKELHLYTLPDIAKDKYTITESSPGVLNSYKITLSEFNKYNSDTQNKALELNTAEYQARIQGLATYSTYTPQFLYYDVYEWRVYLIVWDNTNSCYLKLYLDVIPDGRTTGYHDKVIMKNIKDIKIQKDPNFTGNGSNRKCQIYIKAVDDGKVKELKSDVFIFEKI